STASEPGRLWALGSGPWALGLGPWAGWGQFPSSGSSRWTFAVTLRRCRAELKFGPRLGLGPWASELLGDNRRRRLGALVLAGEPAVHAREPFVHEHLADAHRVARRHPPPPEPGAALQIEHRGRRDHAQPLCLEEGTRARHVARHGHEHDRT